MSIHLKKDDQVMVISGKDKGNSGKIVKVLKAKSKVIVEGINKARKHEKPNQKNEKGGIVDKAMPIHISNVMLISPKSKKPVKVSRKKNEAGKRIRVEAKTGIAID